MDLLAAQAPRQKQAQQSWPTSASTTSGVSSRRRSISAPCSSSTACTARARSWALARTGETRFCIERFLGCRSVDYSVPGRDCSKFAGRPFRQACCRWGHLDHADRFQPAEHRPALGVADMTPDRREGEALGFDYLTLTDHVVLPDTKVPGYPYSESGEFYEDQPTERHEQLIGDGLCRGQDVAHPPGAAAVLVVPHRPAVLAAKMLATIDVLSGGRLVVGIGAGWLKAEFDAVVTTPFAERGAVTDEYIDAFRVLWTESKPRFDGQLHASSTASCSSPSRCSSRTRRSGSAARAGPSCAAPPASAMPGIRSAPTTSTCSTPCRGSRPASRACARPRPRPAATRRRSALAYRVKRYGDGGAAHRLGRRAPAVFRQRGRHHRRLPGAARHGRDGDRRRFRRPSRQPPPRSPRCAASRPP